MIPFLAFLCFFVNRNIEYKLEKGTLKIGLEERKPVSITTQKEKDE